ncbi:TPA: MFS transporter [Morganella morganii subsp. morganii]|uniref:MFS transporter n=1 Tax=Morganella morganii TaxID=582 RepID=UPI00280D5749|nr:MFS transporter [Morganella morganii subsp. morganii]
MISPYTLPVLAFTVFFTGVTEFMVSPMLTPLAAAFDVTPAQASWLIAVYTLSYALAAPMLGRLSDRIGRYRMLRAALLLFVADGIALALAPCFSVAVGLRILGGLASAALIPSVFALIAEQFPHDRQASAMGLVMTGMTAGIISGPVIAGWLTVRCGWYAPFLLTAAGSLVMWIACCFVFRGVSRVSSQPSIRPGKYYSPALSGLIAAKGLWNGTAVVMFVLSGELLRDRFGLNTETIGLISAIFGGGLLTGNLLMPLFRRLSGTDTRLLLISLIVMSVMIAAPVSTAIIAEHAGTRKGEALALSESMNNLSIFILLPVAAAQQDSQILLPAVTALLFCATALTGYILSPIYCKK